MKYYKRIKIFASSNYMELVKEVNEFLYNVHLADAHKIHYQDGGNYVSVLVEYNVCEEDNES